MKTKKHKLTPKQERFVKATIEGLGQSEAAIKAGYSRKHINKGAYQVASYPIVVQEIDKHRREIKDRWNITILDKLKVLWEMVIDNMSSEKDKKIALEALELTLKIEGQLAPEKSVNLHISDTEMLKSINDIELMYKKNY